ncbi:MAG: ABC transporter ATP-binding protein [Limisphaerales bacterium]
MPILSVSQLKKSYRSPDGESQMVVDVEAFTLDPEEQLALSGESGTGKTTFLNLIAGIVPADSGTVTIDKREMTKLSEGGRDRLRAESIGYIFQTFNLLQGYTCLENVLLGMSFGRGADKQFAKEMLARVDLSHRLHHYPRQLSTGQQQRVAVARALANHPKIVLADEPTGNLDTKNAEDALNLIRKTAEENKAALLLVSHDQRVLYQFEQKRDLRDLNQAAAQ